MKILIVCTGNTCRSQMAEGFLKYLDKNLEVYSAGTNPDKKINPRAVKVMAEKGIDISNGVPELVDDYIDTSFDYVITVCDGAKEKCPVFTGTVNHRLHIGFDDPAEATGTEEEILYVFRRVRDEIFRDFSELYNKNIKKEINS